MGTRTRALTILVGLILLAAACSSGGSDSADPTTAPSTTEADAEATTTTTDSGVTTTTGKTATTQGGEGPAPTGDEKLVPLLLEPKDFGPGMVADDSSDDSPEKEYCKGQSFSVDWNTTASMSAKGDDEAVLVGASESIIEFEPGDAAKFMAEFIELNKKCQSADDPGVSLSPAPGFGDEALRGELTGGSPTAKGGIQVALVRVGDEVIVLFGLYSADPLLTDALLNKAVDKVRSGG